MNSEKLYKYCPFNEHTQQSLIMDRLFLAHPSSFNDPFDSLLLLYAKDKLSLKESMNGLRIGSFSAIPNSPSLWAYYADGHQGICLVYDIPKSFNNTDNMVLRLAKVEYDDKAKLNFENDSKLMQSGFAKKSNAWKHEKEWRLICYDKNLQDVTEKKYIKKEIEIKEIILGYRFDKNNIPVIKKLIVERILF